MRIVLTLALTHGMNGAIETNVFFSSVNVSIHARVNADDRCEWALTGILFNVAIKMENIMDSSFVRNSIFVAGLITTPTSLTKVRLK